MNDEVLKLQTVAPKKWERAAIKIVAVLAALNAALLLRQLFSKYAYAYILGLKTPIFAVKIISVLCAAACIYCAVGLWERRERARKIYAAFWSLEILDGLIGLVGWLPASGMFMEVYHQCSLRGKFIWVGGSALIYAAYALVLYFLVSRKRLFS
jgi:hypothetical protein